MRPDARCARSLISCWRYPRWLTESVLRKRKGQDRHFNACSRSQWGPAENWARDIISTLLGCGAQTSETYASSAANRHRRGVRATLTRSGVPSSRSRMIYCALRAGECRCIKRMTLADPNEICENCRYRQGVRAAFTHCSFQMTLTYSIALYRLLSGRWSSHMVIPMRYHDAP